MVVTGRAVLLALLLTALWPSSRRWRRLVANLLLLFVLVVDGAAPGSSPRKLVLTRSSDTATRLGEALVTLTVRNAGAVGARDPARRAGRPTAGVAVTRHALNLEPARPRSHRC
jgi:hypothetical protein